MLMLLFYLCGINMIDIAKIEYRGDGRLIKRVTEHGHKQYMKQMNQALQKMGDLKRVGLGGKKIIDVNPTYKDLTTYWARHTWATLMTSIDAPQDVITMGLSHADGSMNAVYTKLDFDRLDQWNFKLIELVLSPR